MMKYVRKATGKRIPDIAETTESKGEILNSSPMFIMCPVSLDGKFNSKLNKDITKVSPNVRNIYRMVRSQGLLKMGSCWKIKGKNSKGQLTYYIIMVVKKKHNDNIRPADLSYGIQTFMKKYREYVVTSLAIPIDHMLTFNNHRVKTLKLIKNEIKDIIISTKLISKI